ncbi:hypothetical protein OHA57_08030 [Streptomyces anulatus]|uniref:hypothetical protein n=1 Tax=Streptomyces anulatus TaxID=1892 RepID=UPI002DDC8EB5|nr:hypothetical protein [Streptomyces anulatus]WSC60699.1 hypothetical protein OHA57_08030 [Streptomyces anulatus]WSI76814.1 hypothetical protein OG557_07620 [Streptomyces anulatus]
MLQCTAVTETPLGEALVALVRMNGGPDDPDEHLAEKDYLLCELGEHNNDTEHAAHMWTAETEPPCNLWFLWTVSGPHRIHHRFATLPMCPAKLTDVHEGYRQWCGLFDGHPHSHSFHVTDPLREALAERARREARRLISEDKPDDTEHNKGGEA